MATFTEAQVSELAGVLGTNSDTLGYHLDAYEQVISESDKTNVLATLVLIAAIPAGNSVTSVEPKERNFGARIGAGALERKYAAKIAGWLQWPLTATAGVGRLSRC
jgi:hypothetical protein